MDISACLPVGMHKRACTDGHEAPPENTCRLLEGVWLTADDGGATSTSYTTTFSGSAGQTGVERVTTASGDQTTLNCYTAPGVARTCNGKK